MSQFYIEYLYCLSPLRTKGWSMGTHEQGEILSVLLLHSFSSTIYNLIQPVQLSPPDQYVLGKNRLLGWTVWSPEVPSNFSYSVILCSITSLYIKILIDFVIVAMSILFYFYLMYVFREELQNYEFRDISCSLEVIERISYT